MAIEKKERLAALPISHAEALEIMTAMQDYLYKQYKIRDRIRGSQVAHEPTKAELTTLGVINKLRTVLLEMW